MLSWHDVETADETADWGYNVVIHEFAHVIDMRDGVADGVPPIADPRARKVWQALMQREYERLCRRLNHGIETFVDPYGSEGPEEFFAVTVEAFFVAPDGLHEEHPELYAAYTEFFRQDPLD